MREYDATELAYKKGYSDGVSKVSKKPSINLHDDFFGTVLNCAIRYCIGRRTYMPSLVQDFIRPLLPHLSDKTLWCMERDIREAKNYGDPNIDEPDWKRFLADVQKVIEARNESKGKS